MASFKLIVSFFLLAAFFSNAAIGETCRKEFGVPSYFSGLGTSTTQSGTNITIDTSKLATLTEKATLTNWQCHYAELLYQIYRHDPDSIRFALSLLSSIDKNTKPYHKNLHILAFAASWSPVFWEELGKMPLDTKKDIVNFYKKNPHLYSGLDFEAETDKLFSNMRK